MLNLNDVRVFVGVVEHGGFAPAARALRVPKSTLSKRVAELERALDVTLIRRTTRRFVVTPIGREFLEQALAMVQFAEAAEHTVRGATAEPAGPVRITCSVPTAQCWLAALLPRIAHEHPRLRLALHATDRLVDVVREGFDIAVRDHFEPLPDSSLVQRRVRGDALILVASAAYLRRHRSPRSPADLAHHDGLLTRDEAQAWTLRSEGGDEEHVRVTPRFAADETTVLLAAAREGLGVASLPQRACARDLAAGALRRVLPTWTAGTVTTTLLLPDRRARLPGVQAVVGAIVEDGGRSESESVSSVIADD